MQTEWNLADAKNKFSELVNLVLTQGHSMCAAEKIK